MYNGKIGFPTATQKRSFFQVWQLLTEQHDKEHFNDIKHKQVLLQVSDGVHKSMEALFKSPRCVYFTPICTHKVQRYGVNDPLCSRVSLVFCNWGNVCKTGFVKEMGVWVCVCVCALPPGLLWWKRSWNRILRRHLSAEMLVPTPCNRWLVQRRATVNVRSEKARWPDGCQVDKDMRKPNRMWTPQTWTQTNSPFEYIQHCEMEVSLSLHRNY